MIVDTIVSALHGTPGLGLYLTMAVLTATCFLIGIVAVAAGVGGGVLFVPLVSAIFPIHIDYVRGAGLMVALVGAISAAPSLMRRGFSDVRISIPLALCGSVGSILGARLGLSIAPDVVLGLLAVFMFFVAGHTARQVIAPPSGRTDSHSETATARPSGRRGLSDRIASLWSLRGAYRDPATDETIRWRVRSIVPAMTTFIGVGGVGGMLGIGAGWANVPILSSMMGLPIKLAAATSGLVIIANSSAAAWVYLHRGAIRPLVVVPALVGMIAGTRLGARLLGRARPRSVRIVVVVVLTAAAVQTLIGVLS